MVKVLITGLGSYVGESVRKYILSFSPDFEIDAVDTMGDSWKAADYSKYDVVYHVAGIAHVNADPKMEALYYKVNRDLTIEVVDILGSNSDHLASCDAAFVEEVACERQIHRIAT